MQDTKLHECKMQKYASCMRKSPEVGLKMESILLTLEFSNYLKFVWLQESTTFQEFQEIQIILLLSRFFRFFIGFSAKNF